MKKITELQMKTNFFKCLPKYLQKLIIKEPELLLDYNRIKKNEIVDNVILSVYTTSDTPIITHIVKNGTPLDNFGRLNNFGLIVADIIWQYTSGILLGENKLWVFFTTNIKIPMDVLSLWACKCAIELSKIDNINIGIHGGKMKLLHHTDAYTDFEFEGDDVRIGKLMGEAAALKNKKIILTESVNKYVKDKFKTKKIEVFKFFNGTEQTAYELVGKKHFFNNFLNNVKLRYE